MLDSSEIEELKQHKTCECCKKIENRSLLISTFFRSAKRDFYSDNGEDFIKDKISSSSKEYLFCTKCIFDALINYNMYEQIEIVPYITTYQV